LLDVLFGAEYGGSAFLQNITVWRYIPEDIFLVEVTDACFDLSVVSLVSSLFNLVYLRDRYWGYSYLTSVLMIFWVYLMTTLM
jgi:hypothetical protein